MPIVGDVAYVLEDMIRVWKAKAATARQGGAQGLVEADRQAGGRKKCLCLQARSDDVIMPQYAIQRLYELTKDRDVYITTEVGQHQMWAAQFFHFEEPNRWMTSGGLGTMGYGLPAAIGAQMAHPKSLVIDIAGDASILMNIQEMSTAVQYGLPVKVFILNNQYMGMVRQWQQLLHGNRISHSYTEACPTSSSWPRPTAASASAASKPADLDDAIKEMIEASDKPVIFDCRVAALANCFPMIPSGKAHNEMLLGEDVTRRGNREGDRQGRQGAGVMHRAFVLALALWLAAPAFAAGNITWDRAANIKDAAERLAGLQRERGALAAYKFISSLLRHAHAGLEIHARPRGLYCAGLHADRGDDEYLRPHSRRKTQGNGHRRPRSTGAWYVAARRSRVDPIQDDGGGWSRPQEDDRPARPARVREADTS